MSQFDGHNRRKPDKLQVFLATTITMILGMVAYQIIENQANAVTRWQVNEIIEKQKTAPQQWQIDQINQQLEAIRQDQQNIHRTLQRKIPERRP
jgi:hypothetical protein